MSNKNTPNNKWEEQYKREYQRIQQAIKRQEKLGYFVPENIKPNKPSEVKNVTPKDVQTLIDLTPKQIRKRSIYIDKESGEAFKGLDVVNSHHVAKPSKAKVRTPSVRNKVKIPKQYIDKQKEEKVTNTEQEYSVKENNQESKNTEQTAPPKENNLNMQIIEQVNKLISEWTPERYWSPTFAERKTRNHSRISLIWEDVLLSEGEYEVAYRLEQNADKIISLIERLLYDSDAKEEDDFNIGWLQELLFNRVLTATEADWYEEEATSRTIDSLRGENSFG